MESKEMRAAYADTLVELAARNPDIVVLEADLMRATGTGIFQKAYPDRLVNVGIAEANMVGIASGLSATGKIPFASTFACFASRRVFDQFFLSANYARLNVKLVGTDPGVTAAFNGGTHMPFEDLGLMRTIPGLTIIEPSDPASCAAFTRIAAETYGCFYLRLPRKAAPYLYGADEKFEVGKAKTLRPGKDLCFVALGSLMVNNSLAAAEVLMAEDIKASVIDVLSLKPLDAATILEVAKNTGRIISAENHQIAGGLGSAVAELLAESDVQCTFKRIGIRDEFGQVGTQDWLAAHYGLTVSDLVRTAKDML
ncbi:MAG: transketolase C-terminal domain-containing protein [Spirochaetota bacterium]